MIRVLGPRGSGKTTKLLNIAQKEGYVIVEPNEKMADYARHMAIENGLNVNVISAHELLYCQRGVKREKYLIDELEHFLNILGVVGYSDGPQTTLKLEGENVMTNLKPCPFCGGEAKAFVDYDKCGGGELFMSAYVQCPRCGIGRRVQFDASNKQFSDFTDAFDQVISIWNQRV